MVISIDDGVLQMSNGKAILPLDEQSLQIVGGIYDGEIIERDASQLVWQHLVYTRQ